MSHFRTIAVNTLAQYFGRLSSIVASFFVTILLTRSLGRSGYGQFGLITNTILFFATLSDWGTHSIAVREASRRDVPSLGIFSTAFYLRLLLSLVWTLLYVLLVLLYPPFFSFRQSALLATPLIFLLSLKTSSQIIHQVRLRLFIPALSDLVASLVLVSFLFFSISSLTSISLNLAIVATTVATLVSMLICLLPVLSSFRLASFDSIKLRNLIASSLPMGAYLVVFSIYNRLDSYILQYFHGVSATGIYLLSYKVHENLVLVSAYLMNTLFPLLSQNLSQAQKIYAKTFNLLLLVASLVLGLSFIFSPLIIQVMGGPDFIVSGQLLRILLIATFISFFNHLTGYTLIAVGAQSTSLRFALIALAFNIITNLVLVPHFTYFASAYITILTESLMFLLTFIYLKRKYKFSINLRLLPRTVHSLIFNRSQLFV